MFILCRPVSMRVATNGPYKPGFLVFFATFLSSPPRSMIGTPRTQGELLLAGRQRRQYEGHHGAFALGVRPRCQHPETRVAARHHLTRCLAGQAAGLEQSLGLAR